MALRLSEALSTSPELWIGMQAQYDLWQASRRRRAKVPHLVLGRISYGHPAEIISKYFPWMGRIVHTHNKTSVVVLLVHKHGIFALEHECQAPVAAQIYRPKIFNL